MKNRTTGKNFSTDMENIFVLAQNATPYVYEDRNGDTMTEKIGEYRSDITKDMADGMRMLALLLGISYPAMKDVLNNAAEIMERKDLALCRILDDRKAGRELSAYRFEDTEDAIATLDSLYNNKIFSEIPFSCQKSRLKEWSSRLIMMDVRAYYEKGKELLEDTLKMASMRAFDDDGNQVLGISEKNEEVLKIVSKIEMLFLDTLIRLPAYPGELVECMRRITNIEYYIKALVSGDEKTLAYFAKCAEAAEEFDD